MEWRASHILVKEKGLAVELRKRLKSGGNLEPWRKNSLPVQANPKVVILGGLVQAKWSNHLKKRSNAWVMEVLANR